MHATLWVRFVRSLSRGLIVTCVRFCRFFRLLDWQIIQLADLPQNGQPIIFVSNHIEWHDIPLIGWALSGHYRLWWFAKVELINHPMGWWFRCLPMIPVRRGIGDATALHSAIQKVAACSPLVLFPEGTWDDGRMLCAKNGVVRIALATDALIVPIGLTGRMQPLWLRPRTMTVGNSFRLRDLPSFVPELALQNQPITALTTDVMHRITALLPAEYHGYYAYSNYAD
jgi:1-acyl-sn-glycerol-3-phosphate acyltransferase